MDFLLVIIELFSLGFTTETLYELKSFENRLVRRSGASLSQKFRYKGSSSTNHSSCQKLDGPIVWYKNLGSRLFLFVRVDAFDRRTDGQTDRQKGDRNIVRMHSLSHGKNVIEVNACLLFTTQPLISQTAEQSMSKLYQRFGTRPIGPADVSPYRILSYRYLILSYPSPKFFRSNHCKIWPQFSIPVAFKSFWFRNGAKYLKSITLLYSANDQRILLRPPSILAH